ncbi:MAG: serine hydrolase [Pirellulaceae bacterium]|nr:serine hydrolase [Pirellulaceae bacterium]
MYKSLATITKTLAILSTVFFLFATSSFADEVAGKTEDASAEATPRPTLRPVVFPEREWLRADAKESGFDLEILDRITAKMKEAKANGVLIRDGYLIAEWNFGGPAEKRFDIQSCTKSITSLAVGKAIMDGRIPNVDVLVKDYWPDFEAGPYTDKITFRHLLTMTAGILQTTRYGTGQDKQLPKEPAEPGTRYNYLNDQSKALAGALTYLYGRELGDVMNETLKPLGISMQWGSEPRWDPDVVAADGRTIRLNCGYSRAHFSASDLARVGHLYLQKGLWKDNRIISEKFVKESLTPCGIPTGPRQEVGDDGLILTGGYGFKWRQHEYDGVTTWGMHGYGQQFCVIIPEYDVVMTKLSNWRDKSTWIGNNTFYPLLIRSLKTQ